MVTSTANDCASCCDCGNSDKNETTGKRPHFNSDTRRSKSLRRFRFRLCGRNLIRLQKRKID